MKLNIYEKGKVVKTYESDTADIMYGTLEDLVSLIDLDKLTDMTSKTSQLEIGKAIIKAIPLITPMLKEIFVGLTDEEMRRTKTGELIPLFMQIIKFAFSEITSMSDGSGN